MFPNEVCERACKAAVSNQSLLDCLAALSEPPLDQFAQGELLSHPWSGEYGAPVQMRGGRRDLVEQCGGDPVAQLNIVVAVAVPVKVQQKCAAAALGRSASLQGLTDPSEGER